MEFDRGQATDLITLVMQAAATEVLQEEAADQIDQEVQRLLAEMESCRRGRPRPLRASLPGEVARKELLIQ